jgi:hypothetical protein
MMMQLIERILSYANDYLIHFMCGVFVAGVMTKFCMWFLKKSQLSFAKQFEKKIYTFLIEKEKTTAELEMSKGNFVAVTREIMQVAYHELYEMKVAKMRRKLDYVTALSDRLFLLIEGAKRLNSDVALQLRYSEHTETVPDFEHITGYVTKANPAYNRLFGVFSVKRLNSLLALLPGLFVIGGIFGTFVGIMQGLPELSNMDLTSAEMTKKTMDTFLMNIAYSMNTSLVGIILCVAMNVLNSVFDDEDIEEEFAEKLKSCLVLTWQESHLGKRKTHSTYEEIESDSAEPPPLKIA